MLRIARYYLRDQWSRSLGLAAGLHGLGLMLLAAATLTQFESGGKQIGFTVEIEMAPSAEADFPAEPTFELAPSRVQSLVTPEMAIIDDRMFRQMSTAELFAAAERPADADVKMQAEDPAARRAVQSGFSTSTATTTPRQAPVGKQMLAAAADLRAPHVQGSDIELPRRPPAGSRQLGSEETPADFSGNSPAIYPAEAKLRGLQGTVFLRLHVTDQGEVEQVEIVRGSGHPILDGAAVHMVRRWRGRPRTRGGEPIASVETIPIHFRLR